MADNNNTNSTTPGVDTSTQSNTTPKSGTNNNTTTSGVDNTTTAPANNNTNDNATPINNIGDDGSVSTASSNPNAIPLEDFFPSRNKNNKPPNNKPPATINMPTSTKSAKTIGTQTPNNEQPPVNTPATTTRLNSIETPNTDTSDIKGKRLFGNKDEEALNTLLGSVEDYETLKLTSNRKIKSLEEEKQGIQDLYEEELKKLREDNEALKKEREDNNAALKQERMEFKTKLEAIETKFKEVRETREAEIIKEREEMKVKHKEEQVKMEVEFSQEREETKLVTLNIMKRLESEFDGMYVSGIKAIETENKRGDDLEEQLISLATEASRLETEVKDKQEECDLATAKVDSLTNEMKQLKDVTTESARVTKEALANADQELEAAKISLENAQKGYAKVGVKRTKLMQAVVRDSRFISRLEKEMRDMTVENATLQTQLQELQEMDTLKDLLGPDMIQRFNEMKTHFTTDIPPCFDRAMEYIRLQHENRLNELSFPVYDGEGGIITQSQHLVINNTGLPVIYSILNRRYQHPTHKHRYFRRHLNITEHLKDRIRLGYKRMEEELVKKGEQNKPVSWEWGRICESSLWSDLMLRALLPTYLQLFKQNGVTVDDVMNTKPDDKYKTEMCHDIVWEDLLEYLHKRDLSKPARKAIFLFLAMHPAILHPDNRTVNSLVDNRNVYTSIKPSLTGGTMEVGGWYPTWLVEYDDPVTALKSRNTRNMIVLAKMSMMIDRKAELESNSAYVHRPSRALAELTVRENSDDDSNNSDSDDNSNSSDSLQNIGTLSATFRVGSIYDLEQLDDGENITLVADSNDLKYPMISEMTVFVVTGVGGPNEKRRAHLDRGITENVHIAMQIAGEHATWQGIVNNGHEALIEVCVPQDVAEAVTDILKEISGKTELAPVILNVPRNHFESNMNLIAPYTTEMLELEDLVQKVCRGTLPAAPTPAPQYHTGGWTTVELRRGEWRSKAALFDHLADLMPSVMNNYLSSVGLPISGMGRLNNAVPDVCGARELMAARFPPQFYYWLNQISLDSVLDVYENNARRDQPQIEDLRRWGMWNRAVPDFDAEEENDGRTYRTMVTILHATQDRIIAVLACGTLAYAVFAVGRGKPTPINNQPKLMPSHGTASGVEVIRPARSYRIRLREAADPPEGLYHLNEIPCPWRYIPSEHIPGAFSYSHAGIRAIVVNLVANNTIPNYPMPAGVTH